MSLRLARQGCAALRAIDQPIGDRELRSHMHEA